MTNNSPEIKGSRHIPVSRTSGKDRSMLSSHPAPIPTSRQPEPFNESQWLSGFQPKDNTPPESENDQLLIDLPAGAIISSGPIITPGILKIGAPERSTFRLDELEPTVNGHLVSRHGKLLIRDYEGNLHTAPDKYFIYRWLNTEISQSQIASNPDNPTPIPIIPNLHGEERIVIE